MKDNADAIFTWDYEKGARPALNKLYEKAKHSQWNGETDLAWAIDVDPEEVVGRCSADGAEHDPASRRHRPPGTPLANWGDKEWTELGDRVAELDAQPVHARRAGRAALHGQDRRDRAVDRRQVLRVDPGDGRGPPRRGLRQVPRHQADGPLPDQRPPRHAARRHHQRQPLGHDLPRHADHGRGPGPRRLRLHAPDHRRSRCSSSCCAT